VSLEGSGSGWSSPRENLDSQDLPALEMPYGQFRPASVRGCLNGWLRAGGPSRSDELGHHASWRVF
jgi:L-arabinose isomerase